MEDILQGTINEILTQERKPVKLMDKADNVRVVRALDARGIFLIEGAVEAVACALNFSRYTTTTSTKGVGSESSLSTKVDSG